MPLSIDSIRNFAGTGSIMLDAQGAGITSARMQGFKSFFNIGNARQKNAETIVALHQAIMNDPRFGSQDIQAEAVRLLATVQTERAISATQIKDIINQLDAFAERNVEERAGTHLAATPLPAWAAGHEEQIRKLVTLAVQNHGYGADLARPISEAIDRIGMIIGLADGDPDLKAVLFSSLKNILFESGTTLASEDRIRQRVDRFRANLAQFDACARQSADPVAVKKLGVEFLSAFGKPVAPDVIDTLDRFACGLPYKPLGTLGPGSSASDIVRVVHRMAETIRMNPLANADGTAMFVGEDEVMPSKVYMIQRAIAELPTAVQANLRAALESSEGFAASSYIASEASGVVGRSADDFNVVLFASQFLHVHTRSAMGYPGSLSRAPDISGFSPLARCAFNVDHVIVGSGAAALKASILGPHQFQKSMWPGAALHEKIDAGAKSMVCCTFAAEMKKLSTGTGQTIFDKDIVRGMDVRLPNGRRLSNDRALARDELAQFVTGDPEATYAALAPADRAKANVFIALLSQETEKAVQTGAPIALSRTGSEAVFAGVLNGQGEGATRTFAISGSPADGFTIHYEGMYPYFCMLYDDVEGRHQQTPMEQHIVANYELEINIPAASLDRVAATDWASYDSTESDAILAASHQPHRLEGANNAIPEEFRLATDVSAGFTIQADAAQPA